MELRKFLAMAGIPALVLALTACDGRKPPPEPAGSPAPVPSAPIEVTAEDYVEAWHTDPDGAAKKYVGAPIKLTGTVAHIVDGIELRTKSSIVFKGRDPGNQELAQAIFSHDTLPELRKLKEGTKVTVLCTGIKNILLPSCDRSSFVR